MTSERPKTLDNRENMTTRLYGEDIPIKVGMIVVMWKLCESPVLVTHAFWLDEWTRSDFTYYPPGIVVIVKALWPDGKIHEFWARGSDITQVLQNA